MDNTSILFHVKMILTLLHRVVAEILGLARSLGMAMSLESVKNLRKHLALAVLLGLATSPGMAKIQGWAGHRMEMVMPLELTVTLGRATNLE